MIKVTITDNEILSRSATIRQLTKPGIAIMAVTSSSKELIQLLETHLPDIAIINYSTSRPETLIAAEWIKKHYPPVKVIIRALQDIFIPHYKLKQMGIEALVMPSQSEPGQLLGIIHGVYNGKIVYP